MMWMDVDAALTEVPVNAIPLTDDTDFKTVEEAIAYNAAGMALYWHFTTTAGVTTVTAVTPTTGGDYDWAHQDHGIYTIEIPASGGASINNDTEGFGYFTGFCTGVLPWRGPTIGFRDADLNNLLIDSAFSATRGLAGTALPAVAADGVGGLPISDGGGLDLDAILAGTAELQADWANGGRLDLLLDATKAKTDQLNFDGNNVLADMMALNADVITAAGIADDALAAEHFAANCFLEANFALNFWADLFLQDTGETYATAVPGSVVQEIAANVGASAFWTATQIAQITYRLGIDGATDTPAATPNLGTVDADVVKVATVSVTGIAEFKADVSGNATAAGLATVDTVVDAIKVATDQLNFDGNNVLCDVMVVDAAALAQFCTVDTGQTVGAAGSVAKIAQGSAGGNTTVGDITAGALAKFVTQDTGETAVTGGSVAQLSRGDSGSAGSGAVAVTLTIHDALSVAQTDCEVWVTNDAAGDNTVAGTAETDAQGQVTFQLDPGTYYRWAQKTGRDFTNPQEFTVT